MSATLRLPYLLGVAASLRLLGMLSSVRSDETFLSLTLRSRVNGKAGSGTNLIWLAEENDHEGDRENRADYL